MPDPDYDDGQGVSIYHGDCRDVMADMPADAVDYIVTDPPYGLEFMAKDWDFDVPGPEYWTAALRVCKPGAMMFAFGGTRTHHRLMCAIEDAGWEIRDCLMWIYGSGFPKSLDISKAIDKAAGAKREDLGPHPNWREAKRDNGQSMGRVPNEARITAPATDAAKLWDGWGTALKPAWEPIILAMKPLDGTFANNALEHGVAGLNVDGGRIGTESAFIDRTGQKSVGGIMNSGKGQRITSGGDGRWPANLILDEDAGAMLDEQSGERKTADLPSGQTAQRGMAGLSGLGGDGDKLAYPDSGGASRFFYCAKASKAERNAGLTQGIENDHPTVKPLALMRYLLTLLSSPTGGVVLDPFMGSGTTGVACKQISRAFIGVELDAHHAETATQRIAAAKPPAQGTFDW
jgi:site-specific DNA-methyltransferase (adenine-specific)